MVQSYSYYVRDSNGCMSPQSTVVIAPIPRMFVYFVVFINDTGINTNELQTEIVITPEIVNPLCYGGTGYVIIHATGGTGHFNYSVCLLLSCFGLIIIIYFIG